MGVEIWYWLRWVCTLVGVKVGIEIKILGLTWGFELGLLRWGLKLGLGLWCRFVVKVRVRVGMGIKDKVRVSVVIEVKSL